MVEVCYGYYQAYDAVRNQVVTRSFVFNTKNMSPQECREKAWSMAIDSFGPHHGDITIEIKWKKLEL